MKFALRQLAKSPGFTLIAVLSLALGIGANTAIFSLVNEFLLRSLPVRNPDELVLFRQIHGKNGNMSRSESGNSSRDPVTGHNSGTSFSILAFERLRDVRSPAITEVFAFTPFYQLNVLIDGAPETSVSGQLVSGNYHAGLGVPMALGRTLTPADDQPSAAPAAVISHRYWQRRFAGEPAVLGQVIQVNKVPVTLVGVTGHGFNGALQAGESPDLTVTLAHQPRFQPEQLDRAQPWYWWIRVMARLAPGATAARAQAELEPIFQEAAREGWRVAQTTNTGPSREMPDPPTLVLDSGAQGENNNRRYYAPSLHILLGLVSLVLLAACANVANLLLARGAARRREIAVRMALGASRARIVRQLLAEALLIAGFGAALGTALAWWSRDLLVALRPLGGTTMALDLPLDLRVLGFTTAIACTTALLFGLAPALRATRLDLTAEFQGGSRALGRDGRSRLSQTLMVVQIALSLVLLISTGLFLRTLRNLNAVDAGFNHHNLVLFGVDLGSAGYKRDQLPALHTRLHERISAIPGVRAATHSDVAMLNRGRSSRTLSIPGYTPPTGVSMNVSIVHSAANFFDTLQLPLVLGRSFTDRDAAAAPRVAVVNQAFVQRYFANENPLGRRFKWGSASTPGPEIEIVGVARDAKYTTLREAITATAYMPAAQSPYPTLNFSIRPEGDPIALYAALRAAVRDIDPTLVVGNLRTQAEQLDRNHGQELLFARFSGFFGLLALGLACVGLYGLMSYNILRRTGEIGLRMALGALPAHVSKMVLRESLALICAGIVLGIAGAWAASRLVASMLYNLSATDPFTYAAVALILLVVALAATLLPTRRAAKIDPMKALRAD